MPPLNVAMPSASGLEACASEARGASEGDVTCREVARGEPGDEDAAGVWVWECNLASAARWRRSNSACCSAGSRGGEGRSSRKLLAKRVCVLALVAMADVRGRRARYEEGMDLDAIFLAVCLFSLLVVFALGRWR